jgi:predicted lipoprotein
MAASDETAAVGSLIGRWLAGAAVAAGLFWAFPLFHVVPLRPPAPAETPAGAAFDAAAAALRVWERELVPAVGRASELPKLAVELRANPAGAVKRHAHEAGLGGTAYFFVRGSGHVTAKSEDEVKIAVDGADGVVVALAVGVLFGNTLRDGCGLLNVNSYPGLEEFNALSAELNALAESRVLPSVREQAVVGSSVNFAGCAPAPEGAGAEPLLVIVPVSFSVKR